MILRLFSHRFGVNFFSRILLLSCTKNVREKLSQSMAIATTIIGWQLINQAEISDYFHLCRQFCTTLLDLSCRYSFGSGEPSGEPSVNSDQERAQETLCTWMLQTLSTGDSIKVLPLVLRVLPVSLQLQVSL